jgi:hypothetical protein
VEEKAEHNQAAITFQMLITERYKNQIRDVISCYDRVRLRGSLPGWHYAQSMTSFLYANQIRIFEE